MARRSVTGRWRIVEMELWDREAMDLVQPATIEVAQDGTGSFHFIVVQAGLDYRVSEDRQRVEFSWEGFDEDTPVTGRGWASVEGDGTLSGRIYFHMGDDSAFSAVARQISEAPHRRSRKPLPARAARSTRHTAFVFADRDSGGSRSSTRWRRGLRVAGAGH
jgi:hypothetical protein